MIFVFVFVAFILSWFFIEITLFIINKNFNEANDTKKISYYKFIWYLRILAISLLFATTFYMYLFEKAKLLKAIEYCLGIIK